MERKREQLMLHGVFPKVSLGKTKPAPPSVPLPRLTLAVPHRTLSETQKPPVEAAPYSAGPLATVHLPLADPSSSASRIGSSSSSSKFALPRVSAKDWSAVELCKKYESFEHVRRVSALSEPELLSQALVDYERDGIPLVIEDWQDHPSWPQEIFSLEWLLQTSGDKSINVRNMHDRRDQSMTLAEFVRLSRSQSIHTSPGEAQRWYWKDADCPPEWRDWLFKSSAIPAGVLPGSPDNYLGYLPPSEAVESLLCYMGIGDTYTAAHKDLCSSSGHNLMCFSEEDGTSYWFMTAANDAPAVAKYFHQKLRQELDWETHVTTLEELGKAPFTVYLAQQKVGDLVLVPPRSCHQVVNSGGLAMKTSWSRMTLDNLRTALHCELPIYRRVCRPEQYRVKTVLYRSMLHLTEAMQTTLASPRTPKVEHTDEPQGVSSRGNHVGYPDSPSGKSTRAITPPPLSDMQTCAQKLKRLVQLFDEVLRDEFAACHATLEHVLRSETSTGWALTSVPGTSSRHKDVAGNVRPSSSNGFKITLQPPRDFQDLRESGRAKERMASCNLACDFCGADIFQSFFECKRCRTADDGSAPLLGDGLLICPACYVEGRTCNCRQMEPMQCRPFDMLLSDRNDAAKVLASVLPPGESLPEAREPGELWDSEDVCVFEAACALRDYRSLKADKKSPCRYLGLKSHLMSASGVLHCTICHSAKCFRHLLRGGTHSAEAIIKHRDRRQDWHAFHRENATAAKKYDFEERLFDLESIPRVSERLKIAAISFPKCRPGHANVKLGFYDNESGAEDISIDEPEVLPATPVTPEMAKAEARQIVEQLSPLTPVNSSSDSAGSLFGSPVQSSQDLPSPTHLPFPASIEEGEVEVQVEVGDIIEIEYSDSSDGQRSLPAVARPLAYVEVPPLPQYVSALKRTPSSSRFEFATRPWKKPKLAGRGDPEDSALTADTGHLGEGAEYATRHRDRSGDNMTRVADNSASEELVKAFTWANERNHLPPDSSEARRTVKKPHIPRRAVAVVESDDEPPSVLPPDPGSTGALTPDLSLAYPDSPRLSHSVSVVPSSTQESTPASAPTVLSLPRTLMLKRKHTDASLEPEQPPPDRTTARTSLAKLGPIPKKRKGPPGISTQDMARRQSKEQSKEQNEEPPKAKGKSKASAKFAGPGASRRPSGASDSRALVSNSASDRQNGPLARGASTYRTRAESGLTGTYNIPDDVSDAAAPVCAAIAGSALRADDAGLQPPARTTVNSPAPAVPRPHLPPSEINASAPAFFIPNSAPIPPQVLPLSIMDAPSHAGDAQIQLEHSVNVVAMHLPLVLKSCVAAAAAPRSDPRLETELKLQCDASRKQDWRVEVLENEIVNLRRQCERGEEKREQLEKALLVSQNKCEILEERVKKEREERSFMSQTVRRLETEIEHMKASLEEKIREGALKVLQELGLPQPGMHQQQQTNHNPGLNGYDIPDQNNVSWRNQPNNNNYNNNYNNNNHNNGRYNGHPGNPPPRNHNYNQGPHNGPYSRDRFTNNHGRGTHQVTNWDHRQQQHEGPPRGRDGWRPPFQGNPRNQSNDMRPDPRPRSEYPPTHSRSSSRPRRHADADASPVSDLSDHGRRNERTPPMESYPSPNEPNRSYSSIQNSSFPELNDARPPPPPLPHTREGSAAGYPSPRQDSRHGPGHDEPSERSSRSNSRAVDGARPSGEGGSWELCSA